MAVSVSLYILSLSWYGYLELGSLAFFSQILFGFGTAGLLVGIFKLTKHKLLLSNLSLTKSEIIVLTVISVLLLKTLLLYVVRPLIDPDVLYTYLPYARTIFRTGIFPAKDYYTQSPMTVPPIGGPVLLSWSYFLTGSDQTEIFRLMTLPFWGGIVLLTYLFGRRVFSRLYALIGVTILLSLPFLDEMLLNWAAYPDIIYGFLGLSALYLVTHLYFSGSSLERFIYRLILGAVLGSAILLKSQGLFLGYALIIMVFSQVTRLRSVGAVGILFMTLLPLFQSRLPVAGITGFGITPLTLPILVIFAVLLLLVLKGLLSTPAKHRFRVGNFALTVLTASLGLLWFKRNSDLYGNITVPITREYGEFYATQARLLIDTPTLRSDSALWDLWLAPSFGLMFLVPKILGFVRGFIERNLLPHLFWLSYYYVIVLTFFGDANNRYLLPLLPSLAILVTAGVQKIALYLSHRTSITASRYAIFISLFLSIISLTQSKFIAYNFGPAFSFSPLSTVKSSPALSPILPSIIPVTITDMILRSINHAIAHSVVYLRSLLQGVNQVLSVLSADHYPESNFSYLLIIGLSIIAFVSAIGLARYWRKLTLQTFMGFVVLVMIVPYIFIILQVGEFNPSSFAKNEKNLIFNNYGEVTHISPYLSAHAPFNSAILVLGPQTGTAYQTNLPTWNIELGYGLKELLPVLQASDSQINRYFTQYHLNYVMLSHLDSSLSKWTNLGDQTNLVNFVENPIYFRQVISADLDNSWDLFERIIN